tara:strand:+ start:1445 stop:1657 length:213 start_codon:yes stop_codon:yes gene_type:complete
MNVILVMVLCSSIQNSCMPPITYQIAYEDSYTCMVDGYKKSIEQTIELGQEQVNKLGLYIKFGCQKAQGV